MRADTANAGPRKPHTELDPNVQDHCAISQPDILKHKDSLKEAEMPAEAILPRKKKRHRNKHHVIHISGQNIDSGRSNNDGLSVRNKGSESQLDAISNAPSRVHKMMVVQKNQKYVAMVHMNGVPPADGKFSNDGRSQRSGMRLEPDVSVSALTKGSKQA